MPKYDSTEAPLNVVVDDPDAFSGHMDDRPVKLNVDTTSGHVELGDNGGDDVQVSMSPAEAYAAADDLTDAADDCWNGAEYLVTVVHSEDAREGPLESILTTIKAPSPEDAVRRAKDLVSEVAERDHAATHRVRAGLAEDADEFRTYRADTLTAVRTDDDNDN